MSLGARATKGGVKKDGKQDKGKVAEKPAPKEKTKPQATTEQLRMANMIDCKSEDASDVRRMVTELMEMTCRTEEEVCSALHDSDNDLQAACNLLLEESQRIQGEWQTSEKKKKKPSQPAGNGDAERERDARSRSGPRSRRGEGESNQPPGGGRGRGAGRGRGGHTHKQICGNIDSFPTTEDWDNEEWSGSLSDTKVFTPSSNALPAEAEPPAVTEDWESGEANGREHIPTYTYHNTHQHIPIPSSAVEMPGGTETSSNMFIDVQFGALEPDALHEPPPPVQGAPPPTTTQSPTTSIQTNKQVTSQADSQPVPSHETTTEAPSNSYPNANSMLSESISVVDPTPASQPVTSDTAVTNSSSLDKLSASMKQLGVSGTASPAAQDSHRHHYTHHRPKSVGQQQNVYAPHHVSHHPPVYGANVYAPQ
ncbi:lingerer, partial [Danaus plexippus plexippus]